METSAGICFYIPKEKRILLAHPTGRDYLGRYGFPKGHKEEGEDLRDTAIRELKEELGLSFDKERLDNSNKIVVPVRNKRTKEVWKHTHIFVVKIEDISELGLTTYTIPNELLGKKEIDHAGFFVHTDAEMLVHEIYRTFIKLIE